MLSRFGFVTPSRPPYLSLFRLSCGAPHLWCRRMLSVGNTTSSESRAESKKAPPFPANFSVDPKQLPDTIPGVSREELAERLEKYQQELSYKTSQLTARELANEIEMMRRALPPDQFHQFLQDVDSMAEKNEREVARLSAMSPQQLYRYHQRQRRRQRFQAIRKNIMILVSLFGTIFFLFFFMFFFG
ncbi:hypothetical protein TraAM80_08353 [Trypanosoma rangeli]|uniref:Uncharacterized protein n=1 Tax=Trypanosoma rangeli TaxID=5698 RepID=A0A3R7JZ23_TRYRA|nr:uncharacterized protein TraAM80_08353 [Trypanosoma rangeli]RNE99148.1 hypothetical protein TraAM80_08353 [Trypanosoma rangeli]|eukprot:RNE99148.1 hypothetical protein TraAM80_08353 [Trypanosoma rangeli]